MSYTIDDYKKQYADAQARGDANAMQSANDGANAIRQSQGTQQEYATNAINNTRNNQSTITTPSTSTNNSSFNFSDNVKSSLEGYGSGSTLDIDHYGAYYDNKIDYYNKRVDAGNQYNHGKDTMDSYQNSLNNYQKQKNMYTNEFKDWDTGLLDKYIQNKKSYEFDNLSDVQKQKIAQENAELRQFYGMGQDNYSANDLGQLGSDLMFGDFLKHGLNTEKDRDIPAIGSSDEDVNPRYRLAEMMARSNNMLGYEPLGYIRPANMSREEYEAQAINQEASGLQSQFDKLNSGESLQDVLKGNPTTSNSNPTSNKTYVQASDGSGVYAGDDGYWKELNGQKIKLSEDEYVKYMSSILGF